MPSMRDAEASRLTPLNDLYPTSERTVVKLRIYLDEMSPGEATTLLQLTPTKTMLKGRVTRNSLGLERTDRFNAWFLSSEDRVGSLDLRPHLDWLLDQLRPRSQQLLELQSREGVTMSVDCIWWSVGQGGPTLWPEQMAGLAALNLELGLDISFYGAEDDEHGDTASP